MLSFYYYYSYGMINENKFGFPDISKHECEFSDKLRNIILYFSFKTKYLSLLRLVKLIYISEFYFIDNLSERLTDSDFFKYFYGPWCPDIQYTGEIMAGKDIKIEEKNIKDGIEAHFFVPNVESTTVNLSAKEINILDKVIDDWKYLPTKSLTRFCKQTQPFLDVKFGESINFEKYIKLGKPKVAGFYIEIEKEEDGRYSVFSLNPELDGCFSFGDTKEDAITSYRYALMNYLNCKARYINE